MDVFNEALRRLDSLKDLATGCVQHPGGFFGDAAKEAALDDVVQLRRTIIEATRRTEVDRGKLDSAAQTEAFAKASLSSLQSRLHTVEERIETTERQQSDQNRRAQLEQANSRLGKAKKRVSEKRELLEQRQKKLKEFQKELSTPLKLGTPTRISAYDGEERLGVALAALPRPLECLFGQLSTAKEIFDLPIELGLVPKPQMASVAEAGRGEMEFSSAEMVPSSSKKLRASDRKLKHGAEEKRRKRWYEELIGEDSGVSYEDWITPQRALSSSILQQSFPTQQGPKSETQQRYEFLVEIAEAVKRQSATKKQTKRRKQHQSSSKAAHEAAVTRHPLPIPEGELSVEVTIFNGEEEVALLTFSWIDSRVFVSSSPDWLLSQTIQSGDALDGELGKRGSHVRNYRAVTSTYGYPFRWAQELSGSDFLKAQESDSVLSSEEIQAMNLAMVRQQEFILDFIQRVKSQALDLKAFRAGVESLKEEARHQRRDGKGPHFVQFSQIPTHKLSPVAPLKREQRPQQGLASGSWAVVMKKEAMENGNEVPLPDSSAMEVDGVMEQKQPVLMRFYPYAIKDLTQNRTLSKSDVYYEAESPSLAATQFTFAPSEKLGSSSSGDAPIPKLIGPLASQEIGSRGDLVYGQLVVQKGVKIPKRYSGVLHADYETRFFPFELRSHRHRPSSLPLSQVGLYRFYRVAFHLNHIRLSALLRVYLMKPLHPVVYIEDVTASSSFKKGATTATKESKGKASQEGRTKTDHIKTERERVMKKDSEALKMRDVLEKAVNQLESLEQEAPLEKRTNKLPTFDCEDARNWIAEQMAEEEGLGMVEAVQKLGELFETWCSNNAAGVAAVNGFLETGSASKPRQKDPSKIRRSGKASKARSKERLSTAPRTEPRNPTSHEEELEQGEIPTAPKPKHGARHRSDPRRETAHRPRGRSRSPARTDERSRLPGHRGSRPSTRLGGGMRMDDESSRERPKGVTPSNRLRR